MKDRHRPSTFDDNGLGGADDCLVPIQSNYEQISLNDQTPRGVISTSPQYRSRRDHIVRDTAIFSNSRVFRCWDSTAPAETSLRRHPQAHGDWYCPTLRGCRGPWPDPLRTHHPGDLDSTTVLLKPSRMESFDRSKHTPGKSRHPLLKSQPSHRKLLPRFADGAKARLETRPPASNHSEKVDIHRRHRSPTHHPNRNADGRKTEVSSKPAKGVPEMVYRNRQGPPHA